MTSGRESRRNGARRIVLVAGARPNFMKVAPLHEAMRDDPDFDVVLVHTGQHYDDHMSRVFLEELDLPEPDVNLGVGSGTHAEQTAGVMVAFDRTLEDLRPDDVVVVGDVNSTLGAAIVAQRRGIELAHVEAGLRSGDRSMPEEINRVLTDRLADWLYTPSEDAGANLLAEGIPEERIVFAGNVMIDSLVGHVELAQGEPILDELNLTAREYALVTLHRPSNVDDPSTLRSLIGALCALSEKVPVVFPVHPRTRGRLEAVAELIDAHPRVRVLDPQRYLAFLKLTMHARVVITDSGGIQEETTYLNVPCVTVRETTERPITVELGTNTVVGRDPERLAAAVARALEGGVRRKAVPHLWDGRAARRIVRHLGSRGEG